jgi:predicted DNA binding CopG/RHH family protein
MKNTPKQNSDEAWESRGLGASEAHVRKSSSKREKSVEQGLGLQTISIRLQKSLIDDLKLLAEEDGIGYQPYIRQLLTRHARQLCLDKKRRKIQKAASNYK